MFLDLMDFRSRLAYGRPAGGGKMPSRGPRRPSTSAIFPASGGSSRFRLEKASSPCMQAMGHAHRAWREVGTALDRDSTEALKADLNITLRRYATKMAWKVLRLGSAGEAGASWRTAKIAGGRQRAPLRPGRRRGSVSSAVR